MHIEIEKGKTLILRLLAVGPVIEGKGIRDVWFEVNGEVSFMLNVSHETLMSTSLGARGICGRCFGGSRHRIKRESQF